MTHSQINLIPQTVSPALLKPRRLGQGLVVSSLGLGCMGMNWAYGATAADRKEAIATIHRALDCGINFLDTADAYGPHTNEELVGRAIAGRRDEVVLATKFGLVRSKNTCAKDAVATTRCVGRPDYVKTACDASLKRLGVDYIDLYYQHRVDPDTPIEDTVGALKELVEAGKIRHIGLSEATPKDIRRAHAVHPVTAVQSEYSLWSRDPEEGVLETLRTLGIGFVAYAPLGRGFLTGAIRSVNDLADDDYRRVSPRFMGDNFQRNLDIVAILERIAKAKSVTPAQLAIAWLLDQGDDIVPIPGTRRRSRLEENIAAVAITFTGNERNEISAALPVASGERY